MSELVRKLNGRIEIIFGKEDQDNGIDISESVGGEAYSDVGNDVKKALISMNDSDYTNPIFALGHFELYRKPRLIGNKKLFHAVIGEHSAVLRYEFVQPRSIAKWTVSGIKYEYGKNSIYDEVIEEQIPYQERKNSYAIEIPSDFTISLYAEGATAASVTKHYTLITTNGTHTDTTGHEVTVDVSKGIYFSEGVGKGLQKFYDQELSFDTGVSAAHKFSKIEIIINAAWRIVVEEDNSLATYHYGDGAFAPQATAYPFSAGRCNVCWLAKCYDNQTEIYDGGEIQSIEIDRQLPDSEGDISYGIVSNSMKATILNVGRKFDVGYLKDVSILGKRVIPYISVDGEEHKIGTYFVSEWDVPIDNSWVKFSANDRLYDFQNITYTGFFPETDVSTGKFKSESMYRIIESVFEQIGEKVIVPMENKIYYASEALAKLDEIEERYNIVETTTDQDSLGGLAHKMREHIINGGVLIEGIDWGYLNYDIPSPYLERQSVWDVLDNIAKSSLSVIYMDAQDRLIMHSDLDDGKYYLLDDKMYCYTINGEQNELLSANSDQTRMAITQSNAFSLSNPRKRKMIATEISSEYKTYSFSGNDTSVDLIKYYIKDLLPVAETSELAEYNIYVPKYCTECSCGLSGASMQLGNENPVVEHNRLFFRILVSKKDFEPTDYCIVRGNDISFSATKITSRALEYSNDNSIEYSSGTLLNCEGNAEKIINRLLELFACGRKTFESEWIGDLCYDIDLPIKFDYALTLGGNQIAAKGKYRMVSNSLTFDGSLRQTIKAISYYNGE